jgi:ubiquinone/menaquinone biosynthesis C-methylase UbiE
VPLPQLTALAAAVLHVPRKPERVLEVECRQGDGVLFLAREFPAARVRGVDASAEAIEQAVARVGLDPEGRVAFKRGQPRRLPYPDGFFDLVAQTGGRLHPAEIARVLRPDGRLVLVGAWRWLDWRLGKHCFEPVASGEAEGENFHVLRLHTIEPAPE